MFEHERLKYAYNPRVRVKFSKETNTELVATSFRNEKHIATRIVTATENKSCSVMVHELFCQLEFNDF